MKATDGQQAFSYRFTYRGDANDHERRQQLALRWQVTESEAVRRAVREATSDLYGREARRERPWKRRRRAAA